MTQNSSKKPALLRKLSPHEKAQEILYSKQIRSSWARMSGESVVEKRKREDREVGND